MNPEHVKFYCEKYPFRRLKKDDGTPSYDVVSCPVRLSFVNLATMRTPKDRDGKPLKPRYGVAAIIPEGVSVAPLGEAIKAAAREKFGTKIDDPDFAWNKPLRKKSAMAKYKGFEGDGFFFSADKINDPTKPPRRPMIVDRSKQPIDPENKSEIYSGVWAILHVRVYAHQSGVALDLVSVQKLADGEPLAATAVDPLDEIVGPGAAAAKPAPVSADAVADGWQ